jgi:hypothetical protein
LASTDANGNTTTYTTRAAEEGGGPLRCHDPLQETQQDNDAASLDAYVNAEANDYMDRMDAWDEANPSPGNDFLRQTADDQAGQTMADAGYAAGWRWRLPNKARPAGRSGHWERRLPGANVGISHPARPESKR